MQNARIILHISRVQNRLLSDVLAGHHPVIARGQGRFLDTVTRNRRFLAGVTSDLKMALENKLSQLWKSPYLRQRGFLDTMTRYRRIPVGVTLDRSELWKSPYLRQIGLGNIVTHFQRFKMALDKKLSELWKSPFLTQRGFWDTVTRSQQVLAGVTSDLKMALEKKLSEIWKSPYLTQRGFSDTLGRSRRALAGVTSDLNMALEQKLSELLKSPYLRQTGFWDTVTRNQRFLEVVRSDLKTAVEKKRVELWKSPYLTYACDFALFIARLLQIIGLVHIVFEYCFDFCVTIGASMVPTINAESDVVLYDRFSYWLGSWHRGDVVIAYSQRDQEGMICKRIVGLAGDHVVSEDGHTVQVPRGHVWLEGDNRHVSYDSRHYGAMPVALLRGKVRLKLWPLNEICWIARRLHGSHVLID